MMNKEDKAPSKKRIIRARITEQELITFLIKK